MKSRVLHVLSQRPQLTGSGVTLEALVAAAARRGWSQAAAIGIPGDVDAAVAGLDTSEIFPLRFGTEALPFAVPGMSDTMPYASSRFSALSAHELDLYRRAWRAHLARAIDAFRPDLIHCNHLWLATVAARDVAPHTPVVAHCHGTGLRQLELCPQLAAEVIAGVRRCDRFVALHAAQRDQIIARFDVPAEHVVSVGAGYRADRFFATAPSEDRATRVAYAGKLSRTKGVPWLIDAVDRISTHRPVSLVLAGGGEGADAEATRARAARSPSAVLCGRLDQDELAALLRRSDVFVLPSFYEGLPLVLVEALASGCRLVATDLPGVRELAPALGDRLEVVALPRLIGPDEPHPDDLATFTAALEAAIERALDAGKPPPPPAHMLASLSWDAVFTRVERVWRALVG